MKRLATVFVMIMLPLGLVLGLFTSMAQAAASPGAISFVGYNGDSNDGFAFVLLTGSTPNAIVYFTDNEWDGSAFNTTEGTAVWKAPAVALSAGTVITINDINGTPVVSSGAFTPSVSFALAASNEILYAFQGTGNLTPTTFLAAFANEEYASIGGPFLQNTGLVTGLTAIEIDGDDDVIVYTGTTNFTDEASAHAALGNPANWASQDGSGTQDQDSVFPDFPDDVPTAFTVSAPTAVSLDSFTTGNSNSGWFMLAIMALLLGFGGFVMHQRRSA